MSMIDITVPAELEGAKAVVRNWLKKIGDTVAADEPIVELETDKVAQEIPSPAAGVLAEILMTSDDDAQPGAVLGRLAPAGAILDTAPAAANETRDEGGATRSAAAAPSTTSKAAQALSPAVKRALAVSGVDPATINGTGRGGRITRADVEQAAEAAARQRAAAPRVEPGRVIPEPKKSGAVRSIPHSHMRLAIAENMLYSLAEAPHVTAVFEADFSAIIAHRRMHKAAFEKEGVNLTFTAYMVMASVEAMRAVPTVNSMWCEDRVDVFEDINIGVGTALGDKGLIVPVVRRAQELSLQGVASRLGDLIGRARENKLVGADVQGGTFTISNHGVSGSLLATPIIIKQPQAAILGVGKLEKRVVVREVEGQDSIQVRPMCYISLTIDHRVLDGHQTNAWLTKFVETLETWPL